MKNIRHKPKWRFAGFILAIVTMFGLIVAVQPASADSPQAVPSVNNYTPKGGGECTEPVTQFEYAKFFSYSNDRNTATPYSGSYPPQWVDQDFGAWLPDDYVISSGVPATGQIAGGYYWYGKTGDTKVVQVPVDCPPVAIPPSIKAGASIDCAGVVNWSYTVDYGGGYDGGDLYVTLEGDQLVRLLEFPGGTSGQFTGVDASVTSTVEFELVYEFLTPLSVVSTVEVGPADGCETPEEPEPVSKCVDGQWVITAVAGPIIIDGPNDQVTLQTGESHTMVGGFAELYGPTHRVEDFLGTFTRPDCEPTEECPEGQSPNMFGECVPDPVIPEVGVSRDCYTITVTSEEEIDYIDLDFYDTLPDPNARIFVGEGRTSYTFEVDPDGPELIGVWIKSADNGGDGLPGAGEYVNVDPAGDDCEPTEEFTLEVSLLVPDECGATQTKAVITYSGPDQPVVIQTESNGFGFGTPLVLQEGTTEIPVNIPAEGAVKVSVHIDGQQKAASAELSFNPCDEEPEECPEGQEMVGDKCVNVCPEGSSRDDEGNCVQTGTPPDPETCPEGYVMSGGACIKEVKPEKPAPTTTTTPPASTVPVKPNTDGSGTSTTVALPLLMLFAVIAGGAWRARRKLT